MWAQAAGGWGSSDRRALVLLTAGEGRGRAPPLPELPMGHRVALSVGAVTPSVLSWLTLLRPVFVLHRLQDVSVSPRASREAPSPVCCPLGLPTRMPAASLTAGQGRPRPAVHTPARLPRPHLPTRSTLDSLVVNSRDSLCVSPTANVLDRVKPQARDPLFWDMLPHAGPQAQDPLFWNMLPHTAPGSRPSSGTLTAFAPFLTFLGWDFYSFPVKLQNSLYTLDSSPYGFTFSELRSRHVPWSGIPDLDIIKHIHFCHDVLYICTFEVLFRVSVSVPPRPQASASSLACLAPRGNPVSPAPAQLTCPGTAAAPPAAVPLFAQTSWLVKLSLCQVPLTPGRAGPPFPLF